MLSRWTFLWFWFPFCSSTWWLGGQSQPFSSQHESQYGCRFWPAELFACSIMFFWKLQPCYQFQHHTSTTHVCQGLTSCIFVHMQHFHLFPSYFPPFSLIYSSFFESPESRELHVRCRFDALPPWGRGGVFESHGRSVPVSTDLSVAPIWRCRNRGSGEAGGEQSLSRQLFAKSRSAT